MHTHPKHGGGSPLSNRELWGTIGIFLWSECISYPKTLHPHEGNEEKLFFLRSIILPGQNVSNKIWVRHRHTRISLNTTFTSTTGSGMR